MHVRTYVYTYKCSCTITMYNKKLTNKRTKKPKANKQTCIMAYKYMYICAHFHVKFNHSYKQA